MSCLVFRRVLGCVMCDIDLQVEFAKTIAAGLEQTIIAALTIHGPEIARRLLEDFLYDGGQTGSRAILIQLVVACMAEPRVMRLLPETPTFDDLPPPTVLAEQYYLRNAVEAAEEEPDPGLRQALLQRAREIATDAVAWPVDATTVEADRLLRQDIFVQEEMLRRH